MQEQVISLSEAYDLAARHHELGEYEQAEAMYRALLSHLPDNPAILYGTGAVISARGRCAEGLVYLRRAVAADPSRPIFLGELSKCLAKLGMIDEALAEARRAIQLGLEDEDITQFLAHLESRPWFPGLQGWHAPERQVYMSALLPMVPPANRPISILEVGTYMGGSLCTWAAAVDRLTDRRATIDCIDPWELVDASQYGPDMGGHLTSGISHRVFRHSLKYLPDRVEVTEHKGFSSAILPTLPEAAFDIIYVDGCHLHPEVLQDLRDCAPLLRDGGVICGDDLEAQLHEVDAAYALHHARADMVVDPRSDISFHPGVTLGVGEFFGPVSEFGGFWAMRKAGDGFQPVSMAGGRGILPHHWPASLQELARKRVAEAGLLARIL